MRKLFLSHTTEFVLFAVIIAMSIVLAFATDRFFTLGNGFDLLNISAVNIIFAVGLLVVLISGGIDISFAVAASIVQYVTALALERIGGGGWLSGLLIAGGIGIVLGVINAFLIHRFRIISIVATIATFNVYFGLLMFFTKGVSIYDLPDWLTSRVIIYEREMADGSWAEITLPVVVMVVCTLATWLFITRTTTGRQLYAFGDNPEGARRFGINIGAMQFIAFGWLGLMAGIAGLMQAHYAQEVVPNALYGRELDVLAAVVLGGARLGGGKGSVLGCVLGVLLVSITQNGLNLMGVSPFAFKMIVGAIILVAITLSSARIGNLVPVFATRKSTGGGPADRGES
ncbi:ABC transporter permease (plasmid) [Rhizobium leguminosarum]|uniref:ABC transporter permease n=1 Tax=Rhizobium TaxID=379 RepID=UPI001031051B|nr:MULTISPECIES: ABC transporter permease [Rhizobium]MBY5418437.1 ABC transporter permease [Rhizobium leguminosarum]TBF28096.1 ABC transporter permease [Rhizobium leguminosarum]TBF46512.1 ABC transporter permease [Rhizobium leguminosarum]TBF48855.1 ABC transporter permease [Rhizobium leguminosarum]TBF50091.1 ABC transporter permease [Rhizobium leguminosarum]